MKRPNGLMRIAYSKDLIKIVIFYVLYKIGSIYKTKGTPILSYHSIDNSGSPISFPPELFARQMEYLKSSGYICVSLKELYGWVISHSELPEKSVVLTFDDGFKTNYKNLFPILKRFGFNATIFLVTDFIGRRMTWRKADGIPDFPMLSWAEIKEMHNYGIDFQPHGASHSFLTTLSEEELEMEICRSVEKIEGRLRKKVDFFCYPYGDHDANTIKILKRKGFLGACSAIYGKVVPGDNPYVLKRICMESISGFNPVVKMLFLKASLHGAMQCYISSRKMFPWFFKKPYIVNAKSLIMS